jgi:hypothetical protein
MTLVTFDRWIGYLASLIEVALLVQFIRYGIARKYDLLLGFFLADVLQTLVEMRLSTYSKWYGEVYFGGQALKFALGAAFAIRLWSLALSRYGALARFGRWALICMLLAAVGVAAGGRVLDPPQGHGQSALMHSFQAIEGTANSMLAAFLAVGVLFLLWFPLRVSRNVAVCIAGFVFYSFQRWAGLLLVNQYPKDARLLSAIMSVLLFACLAIWLAAIRPKGEIITTITGHRWNPAESERLLGQLDSINALLKGNSKAGSSWLISK